MKKGQCAIICGKSIALTLCGGQPEVVARRENKVGHSSIVSAFFQATFHQFFRWAGLRGGQYRCYSRTIRGFTYRFLLKDVSTRDLAEFDTTLVHAQSVQ